MADKYIRKRDAIDMCGGYGELARCMSRIKTADVLPYSIGPDGTLTITVPKDAQVGRVLVQEEGTQWGGLFYPDSADVIPISEILQVGYEGREARFHIGGRLFAIRELAQ